MSQDKLDTPGDAGCRVRQAVELLMEAAERFQAIGVAPETMKRIDDFIATVHPAECSPFWNCSAFDAAISEKSAPCVVATSGWHRVEDAIAKRIGLRGPGNIRVSNGCIYMRHDDDYNGDEWYELQVPSLPSSHERGG